VVALDKNTDINPAITSAGTFYHEDILMHITFAEEGPTLEELLERCHS